jgi:hypothetical protein
LAAVGCSHGSMSRFRKSAVSQETTGHRLVATGANKMVGI